MTISPIRALIVVIALLSGLLAVGDHIVRAEPAPTIESGSLEIGTTWSTVSLTGSFADPVVIVGPPTATDTQPVTVQVRNVNPSSFEIRLHDWNYARRNHRAETVTFMVLEAGTHEIDGRTWVAGHADDVDHTWSRIRTTGFGGGHVVLGSVVSARGGQAVSLRFTSVDRDGFRVRLEEERASDRRHVGERVDYVLIPCCINNGDSIYRTGKTMTGKTARVEFPEMDAPLLFANVTSVRGADPVTLRTVERAARRVVVGLEEERSDGEGAHPREQIRYMVLDSTATGGTTSPTPVDTVPTPTTQPPVTEPPVTEPPVTAPPVTQPPVTAPPVDASCFRPSNPVRVTPNQDIAAIAKSHPAGTTFLLTAGTHRLADISPKRGQTFVGERGPDCEHLATMSGAEQVTSWTSANGKWKSTGHARAVETRNVPCENGFARCQHPQDLYVNGSPLKHVGSKSAVKAGTWFFDYGAKTLWIGENPNGKNVELSVAEAAFRPTAENVRIVGLRMVKYANRPQFGVIGRHGTDPGWVIEDNEIGISHSVAAVLGTRARFVDNHVSRQGGLGVKVTGASVVARGNTIVDNGWAGQVMTWEGGGMKISARGATVAGNCIADNRGPGLWGDEGAHGVAFDGNTVFNNETQGIFYEISDTATISNNRVGHNGVRSPWLYGGQIMISTSSNVDVVGNTVEVNHSYGNGITVIWQDRHMGQTVGNTVSGNDITFLSDQGVTGMRSDWNGGNSIYDRNTFAGNAYHSNHHGDQHFKGVDGAMTLTELKHVGQERGSTIDRDVSPTDWGCATT